MTASWLIASYPDLLGARARDCRPSPIAFSRARRDLSAYEAGPRSAPRRASCIAPWRGRFPALDARGLRALSGVGPSRRKEGGRHGDASLRGAAPLAGRW